MKILKGFLLFILSIVLIVFLVTFFLPSRFKVERSVEIDAPRHLVYYYVDDLRNWKYWDSWWKLDTNQIRIYEGPLFGLNSLYRWESKQQNVGTGELKIVEAKPFDSLKLALRFGQEMVSSSKFVFEEVDGKTKVNWMLEGELSFLAKWLGLFMDEAIGKDFLEGLNSLKGIAEKTFREKTSFFVDSIPNIKIVYITDSSTYNFNEISQKYASAFPELFEFAKKNNLVFLGAPISMTKSFAENKLVFDACIPVLSFDNAREEGRIRFGEIPTSKVVRTVYFGSYSDFSKAYTQLQQFLGENKIVPKGPLFEMYYTDPSLVKSEHNLTLIFAPF
ncbi:MAG: SRPBCC family protein [Ignavibacteria bacterium]|nr:SRPBCC family protein [Ignavibacteria bacterium]